MVCQTKDYKTGICLFAKHRVLMRKGKNTGWLGIRTMYSSEATYLPADYCFSELAIQSEEKKTAEFSCQRAHTLTVGVRSKTDIFTLYSAALYCRLIRLYIISYTVC